MVQSHLLFFLVELVAFLELKVKELTKLSDSLL
jgi:hypothetical protein